jgi:uncharacterized damage-inducible protein DinB
MSTVSRWFDRQFEFTFPVEQYPNLCVRLRGTPARVEELARNGAGAVLTRKPGEKWSAQEHMGHLLDLEPLWLQRVEDFVAGDTELSAADLSNRKTHEANYNVRPLEKILTDFRSARLQLVRRVEELEPAWFARVLIHPRLQKPMRLVDHLYFVAEHDDHHLARIWELIR